MSTRDIDVVVLGATGFTGKLVVEYLAEKYTGSDSEIVWAVAGRSQKKLEKVLLQVGEQQGVNLDNITTIVADSGDKQSLLDMCKRTKVVMSSVGPYSLYGSLLVECCEEADTDYCDLTGEWTWVKDMVDAHHEKCKKQGTRIVHMTGYDSIPSELGMLSVAEVAQSELGEADGELVAVSNYAGPTKGGFSHGTAASGIEILSDPDFKNKARDMSSNPYFLCSEPDEYEEQTRKSRMPRPDYWWPEYNKDLKSYSTPFIMAIGNVRIMQRSLSLLSRRRFGKDIVVRESLLIRKWYLAYLIAIGMAIGAFFISIGPIRSLVKKNLPGSGYGPSRKERERGCFVMTTVGETKTGKMVKCVTRGTKDPGYGATSQMFAETAVALAVSRDEASRPGNGGVLTPSSAPGLGMELVDRLNKNSCVSFQTEVVTDKSDLKKIECYDDKKKTRSRRKSSRSSTK